MQTCDTSTVAPWLRFKPKLRLKHTRERPTGSLRLKLRLGLRLGLELQVRLRTILTQPSGCTAKGFVKLKHRALASTVPTLPPARRTTTPKRLARDSGALTRLVNP